MDDRASIVRRRETEADVLRRDVMPEHLRRKQTVSGGEEARPAISHAWSTLTGPDTTMMNEE
jgi:hypothetical protein